MEPAESEDSDSDDDDSSDDKPVSAMEGPNASGKRDRAERTSESEDSDEPLAFRAKKRKQEKKNCSVCNDEMPVSLLVCGTAACEHENDICRPCLRSTIENEAPYHV